jgi:uncharacterized protein YkwD
MQRISASSSRARLAALAAVGAAALALAAPSQSLASQCPNANGNPNQMSLTAARQATLCLLNQQRQANGLRPLGESHDLNVASQRHSRDMAVHKYFAHGNFVGRIRAAGYLSGATSWIVGENIAWGSGSYATPAEIVNEWMHSPPHRENILRSSFHQIGLGIARGAPESGMGSAATYTTDFGSRN